MTIRESPYFTTVSLEGVFNAQRSALPEPLRCPNEFAERHGRQVIRGIPFLFGSPERANVVLLAKERASIDLGGVQASYLLFVHVVEEAADMTHLPVDDAEGQGYGLGAVTSEYQLQYEDGSTTSKSIFRRFSIQQARCSWGSAPFACVPAADDQVLRLADETLAVGESLDPVFGLMPTRMVAATFRALMPNEGLLWLYALPNPKPEARLAAVTLRPREERSALYALTLTELVEHPLRPSMRRKLLLRLPEEIEQNAIGELDGSQIGLDLGAVISARAALEYDRDRWRPEETVVEPTRSKRDVLIEYAAHPQARLYVGDEVYEPGVPALGLTEVRTADRPVRLRFVDKDTRSGLAVRLHIHGEMGEYLPPRGHHRKVNGAWHQDNHAEFVNSDNQYAYVDGDCIVDLPLGTVYVEITRGYEVAPIRTSVEVGAATDELVFELERVLRWRERGWVTADTHVHFLSPQTALLEGQAEGVNVVNLLASQWGEMFSNVGDFDGKSTFGANDLGGQGEFMVRVGSENRMHVLGHISLLGYRGPLIHPLCTGGPDESALGDPLEVSMAEWAQRCLDQGGLVVMPHAPTPQLERAADIVLDLVNAIELMNTNPLRPSVSHPALGEVQAGSPLNPYGIADWYRYLNLGYHVPLVGGSDKMAASALLGGIRTYAHLGDHGFTFNNWMEAVRRGNTFVTVGPLISLTVEGTQPGGQLQLPAGGGTVEVEWRIESLRVPIEAVEIVVGARVEDSTTLGGTLSAEGHTEISVSASTWIALRVRGSYHGNPDHVAAHTSAVQVLVDSSELFSETDSIAVLDQIQGAIAYVDTIAPRAEARRFQELRATLEMAYDRLHQRMHAVGIYHRHHLHDPGEPHEH